jgi:hypothetical protein
MGLKPNLKWGLVLASALAGTVLGCGHGHVANQPTVAIVPFEALGVGGDSSKLGRRAAFFARTMTNTLESDAAIRVLEADPDDRQRRADTGRIEGVGHMVYGSLMQDREGALVLSWRLVAAGTGTIVTAGNVIMTPGSESDSVTAVGNRIAALLRSQSNDST